MILLQGLLRDEPSAWSELVGKYSPLLLGISRRTFASYGYAASNHDCEDAVADVWRNLLHNDRQLVRQCIERGQLLPTLHVLTRNRTVDLMRRRKLVAAPLEEATEIAVCDAETADPDERDVSSFLPQALARLSPRERALVELFYLQAKSYREIELLIGVPQNSIGPTLKRAVAKLKAAIDDASEEMYAVKNGS